MGLLGPGFLQLEKNIMVLAGGSKHPLQIYFGFGCILLQAGLIYSKCHPRFDFGELDPVWIMCGNQALKT